MATLISKRTFGSVEKALIFMPALDDADSERLLKSLQLGEISEQEFIEVVYEAHKEEPGQSQQAQRPHLKTPTSNTESSARGKYEASLPDAISLPTPKDLRFALHVRKEAPALVKDIFDNWEKLRVIAGIYSEALNKRWNKRIVEKRKAVLLKAWPGMNPRHRPDFDIIRRKLKGPLHRDALLMPYINLEDLSSSKNLINLIESRVKMSPEHFAWSDSASYETAEMMEAVKPATRFSTDMLLTGQKTRATYGRLLDTLTKADGNNNPWTGFGFRLGQGFVILETQKRLYQFLLRCTEILLHDMHLPSSVPDCAVLQSVQIMRPRDTTMLSESGEWQSMSDLNTQASYHLPQPFSVETLRRLAGAKRDEAEDSFWALHEDPAYFLQQLEKHWSLHVEPCRRLMREKSKFKLSRPEHYAMEAACTNVILSTCRDLVIWEAIMVDLLELEDTRASLKEDIQLSKRLPLEYEKALEKVKALMAAIWADALSDMCQIFLSSPAFTDFVRIEDCGEGYTIGLKRSTEDRWPPLLKLLGDLSSWSTSITMGAMNILDEMERIVSTDPAQRAMVGTHIAEELSRMSAFAQIQVALCRHRPTYLDHDDAESLFKGHIARLKKINDLHKSLSMISIIEFVKPRSAFDYPVGKRRTLQHVEQMRLAESKLDAFWKQVDQQLLLRTGKTLQQWMGGKPGPREIQRTPAWQPSEEKQQSRKASKPSSPEVYSFSTDSTPHIVPKAPTEPKKKEKTRGEADPSKDSSGTEPAAIPQDIAPPTQTFPLNIRARKTMTTLYPTTLEDRTARTVLWKDFLHAMYSLGFEIQKRQGSEWYFEPSWRKNAPITIHEPHPSREMKFDKIRFEANRMARKYGWSSESFVAA